MIAKDIRTFLKRFETTLTVLAREGRHVDLESRFEDYQKILGAWLDVTPPDASPPERIRLLPIVDSFKGPFELDPSEIVRAATLSGDTSTVVVVADQLLLGAFVCNRRAQPRLMEEFLNILVFLYYSCVEHEDLANAVSHRLDSGLYSLFVAMRATQVNADEVQSQNSYDVRALDTVLRFSLALVHAAIRYQQTQHAENFFERIFHHRKYRTRLARETGTVTMNPEVLFDYAAVVLAGWALHILQTGVLKDSGAARSVLDSALSQVPSVPVLVAEWELLRGAGSHNAIVDNRLGIAHWDVHEWHRNSRVGIVEVRAGGPDWVKLGLRAALLRSQDFYHGEVERLFSNPPRRFVWDAAKERAALETLAADPWLDIPEDKRETRVVKIMEVIGKRAQEANSRHLRDVLDTPLSQGRIARFRDDAVNAFHNRGLWQQALRRAGLSSEKPRVTPLRTRFGFWVPREFLLDDKDWDSGMGDFLGQQVVTRAAISLIHLVERTAQPEADLKALATLPETVREARRKLMEAGFSPNVVVLPGQYRFAHALFQKPLWQVEGRQEFGDASVGVWERLHVLRFPYSDPEGILVLDTRRLITDCGDGDGSPAIRVWIEEDPQDENDAAKKQAARIALTSANSPIPEPNVIQVLAWMEALPRLGIVNTEAAVAIDIRNSDGGYAIVEDSNLYHRPSCPDIEMEDAKYVLQFRGGDDRIPCPSCHPEPGNT